MKNYLVSIIIPNYNHAIFLQERLDSIFNQTFQNFEVIILDDASTDDSLGILKKYKEHPKLSHFLINKENKGSPFKQWNKGIKLAKGEFIWIAEADDFSEPEFLEKTLKPLTQDSGVVLSFCQSTRMNSQGQITGSWLTHTDEFPSNIFQNDFIMHGNHFIEDYLIHKNVIPNVSAVIFRKSNLEKIMPLYFASYQKYNADWYFYIKLLCNAKVAFISKCLNHFRYHPNSVISRAGSESGWMRILEMELKSRNKMLNYLESCKPSNLKKIKIQAKCGNDKLHYLIAEDYINKEKYLKGIAAVLNNPFLFIKALKKILIKTIL